ncbi:MAG: DNA topoisomerase VI subunit B, partial [Planctomycetota bacterium]
NRGKPLQIEEDVAFGRDVPGDQPALVILLAKRVPLLSHQSGGSAFQSVTETAWRNYGLSQPRGSLPVGPMVIMIHMASVWVPFTSESKEAIADYDEIRKEMRLALQECGRKLGTYLRKRQKMRREGQRRDIFERYIGEIAKACESITGTDAEELYEALKRQAQRRTEIADAVLDEDGKVVKKSDLAPPKDDDGVLIVSRDDDPSDAGEGAAMPPAEDPDGSDEAPSPSLTEAKPTKKASKKKVAKKKVRKKVKKKTAKKSQSESGLFTGSA